MKKYLATILAVSVMAALLSSCDSGRGGYGGSSPFDDDDDIIPTTTGTQISIQPKHFSPDEVTVDAYERFDDYYVDNFKEAWGAKQDLKMAGLSVHSYFNYYSLDYNNNRTNVNLNFISTLNRPMVLSYPAEKKGYTVYEVTYTQLFPIQTKEFGGSARSFFSYHGVGYVDYYTGTTFPLINLSTQIDSFCVSGNVIYKGKTYEVSYYEFREQNLLDSDAYSSNDGGTIEATTIELTTTSYFIVPDGYDGILMYAFVADDTDTPLDEVLADDSPYFEAPGFFGDDENSDDYEFFLVTSPK